VSVAALAAGALLSGGAQAALAQGTLTVCQSSANGMAAREFQFSVNGGAPFTVLGGRCTPLTVAAGDTKVEQLQTSPATAVTAIGLNASRLVRTVSPNPNLAQRRVAVIVPEGSTALTATRVSYTNSSGASPPAPGGGGTGGGTGAIEICKLMAPGEPAFDGRPFQFRVDGGAPTTVGAGRCSQALLLPAGNHTIVEVPQSAFELESVETIPGGRVVTQNLAAGSAVVSVPAGVQNETVALFRNRVARGQVKLCKAIAPGSEDALGGKAFALTYSYRVPAGVVSVTVSLRPGECSLPSVPLPVIDAAGNPTLISVTETPGAGFEVDSIHLQGTAGPLQQTASCPRATPYGCFPLGRATNSATFINRATNGFA
jgi:hypothetical protein